jgi:hypothetical protein
MTTVVSPGAESRADSLAERAERARDWLGEQLAAPFDFDLYVLDEDDWAEHTEVPLYAMPHANPETGKIVLGPRPTALFGSVCTLYWPDLSEDSRGALHEVYGDPPELQGFADLILVHELMQLVPRAQPLPTMWHEELFANLGAVGYLASEEPDELPVYLTFCRAGCDVPPSRVACSTLADMPRSLEEGGPANYVWYQFRLILAAERLWNTHGVEALRALKAGEVGVVAEVERDWR